ncbi:MAG: translocation/assembly module TamB domain-containing protein [Planctomycetes bacterium]|nr:translocation/assembly module TamB domain-containing protein [Planctomycetota bacterium]
MTKTTRRGCRRVLVLLVVLGVVGGAAWVLRARILDHVLQRVAHSAGVQATWQRLEMDGLGTLRLHDLSAVRAPDIDTRLDRLEVEFDAWKLVRGDLGGLKRIEASGVEGTLGPFASTPDQGAPSEGGAFRWPSSVPILYVQTGRLVVHVAKERSLALRGASLQFDGVDARVKAEELSWTDHGNATAYPLEVTGAYRGGRFEIAHATWDPRIVLEKARLDLTDIQNGRASFDLGARAFGGMADIKGRLDEAVVYASGNVVQFDVGALVRAYVPSLTDAPEGVLSLNASVRVPLEHVLASELNARFVVRDLRSVRDADEISGRLELKPDGVRLRQALIVHGDNALRIEADAPPITSDMCSFAGGIHAFAEAVIGDVPRFVHDDIGLDWTLAVARPVSAQPIRVRARLAALELSADIPSAVVELAPLMQLFDGPDSISGNVELSASVRLPLERMEHFTVAADLIALDLSAAGRHADCVALAARLDEDGLSLSDAFIAEGTNTVRFAHARIPDPPFDGCGYAERARVLGLRADLNDLPLLVRGETATEALDRLSAHRVVFEGTLIDGALVLHRGEFETEAGAGRIERGLVPLHDDFADIILDSALDVEVALRFDDVSAAISALAPGVFAEGDVPRGFVAGNGRLRGGIAGPSGRLDLTARDLYVRDVHFDDADVLVHLDERVLRVQRASARSTLGTLSFSGGYEFATQRVLDARVDADVADLVRLAPGSLPSGRVTVHARANGVLATIDGAIELTATDIRSEALQLERVELRATATAGALQVERLAARGYEVDLELSGSVPAPFAEWEGTTLELSKLGLVWNETAAGLAGPVQITRAANGWSVPRVILESDTGAISASLSNDSGAQRLELTLSGELPAELFAPLSIQARDGNDVEVSLSATWRAGEVDLEAETTGSLSALDTTLQEYTTASWQARLKAGRIDVDELEVERSVGLQNAVWSARGSAPFAPLAAQVLADGPLQAEIVLDTPDLALVPFLPEHWRATGITHLSVALRGAWDRLTGTAHATLAGVALPGLADVGRLSGAAQLTLGDTTTLDEADISLDDLVRLRAAGALALQVSPRALFAGDTSAVENAALDLAVRVDAADLSPITARVPTLRRARGAVHADLRLTGTPTAPHFAGEAVLTDGEIRTTTNLPSIVDVTSRVRLDGDVLHVDTLAGEMGGAPFEMNGSVSLGGAQPTVDLKLSGTSLLLWRERDVSVRADAALTLTGPVDALVLAGDLQLRDGRYTRKLDFLSFGRSGPAAAGTRGLRLFALTEPPFSTMRFDVRVESATPFKIANNVARGQLTPSLALLGTGALPELRGHVIVEPSRVLLPSGALSVRAGRIEFRPDRPDVPELDIQASARLQGYDVEVRVSGPIDDPRVDLSSVPPLPREDLALLVISGRLPGNSLASGVGQRAAVDIAVYIARDVAVAWFEADEDNVESIAERLEVVVGSDTTRSGADAVLVRFRLAGDLQKRGHALFATGERDVYDFYNVGLRLVFTYP